MTDKTDIELLSELKISKDKIYDTATLIQLGSNANGTRMDVIYEAMELYALAALALKEKQMQGELTRLKQFDGNDDHPENRCQKCTGRNLHNWYADNDTWNKVVGDKFNQLCPNCFTELAKEVGIDPAAWRLSMEGDLPEVDILRDQNFHLKERLYQLQNQLSDLSDEYELHLCKKCLHPKAMLCPGEYQCINTECK